MSMLSSLRIEGFVLTHFRAAWLRKSHPTWIDVPLLIVSCVSCAVACKTLPIRISITSVLTLLFSSSHSRRLTDCAYDELDDCCKHYAQKQDPLQVAQDCRNTGIRFSDLF